MSDQDENTKEQRIPVPEFYVDSARVNVSAWSVLIEFGLHPMPFEQEMSTSDPVVRIRMSPHHAKATSALLTSIVQDYEKQNGELKLPGLTINTTAPKSDDPTRNRKGGSVGNAR